MSDRGTWAVLFWASWLASCGGAPAPSADRACDQDEVPCPPRPWAEMSHDDRAGWMYAEVMPRMGERFEHFDDARYDDFSCGACHGPNADERGFAMPSPSLPALYATGTPEQHQMVREYPEMVRFMFNDVVPTVQALLGAPDYDEATGEGFSCYACHPHAGDEGTTPVRLGTNASADRPIDVAAGDAAPGGAGAP